MTRLSGWWERPQVKRNVVSRELGDGDFLTPWNYEARRITIGGVVSCASHDQMHHVMDQLNGLCASRREWLHVQGHGGLQSALIEADDGPLLVPLSDRQLEFSLPFRAPDPRKYGEIRTADVGHDFTSIRQYGNYPATPLFSLRAQDVGDTGFQLSGEYEDGERRVWWYNYSSSDWTHNIDFARGTHMVGSTPRPERVRYSETFQIRPHQVTRVRARPHSYDDPVGDGDVSGTVTWRDTWI